MKWMGHLVLQMIVHWGPLQGKQEFWDYKKTSPISDGEQYVWMVEAKISQEAQFFIHNPTGVLSTHSL